MIISAPFPHIVPFSNLPGGGGAADLKRSPSVPCPRAPSPVGPICDRAPLVPVRGTERMDLIFGPECIDHIFWDRTPLSTFEYGMSGYGYRPWSNESALRVRKMDFFGTERIDSVWDRTHRLCLGPNAYRAQKKNDAPQISEQRGGSCPPLALVELIQTKSKHQCVLRSFINHLSSEHVSCLARSQESTHLDISYFWCSLFVLIRHGLRSLRHEERNQISVVASHSPYN